MADRAFITCCHACKSVFFTGEGPQCDKYPHNYKTFEQQAVVRWLCSPYGKCPGFHPSVRSYKEPT